MLFLLPFFLAAAALPQDSSDGFRALADEVEMEVLDNGLRVIVLPRGRAPVVSFRVHVNAGAIDEDAGLTGLAHFAEHMAFKGSERIGAGNWLSEKIALEECDRAWKAYEYALAIENEDAEELLEEFEVARLRADSYSLAEEFDAVVEEAGGADSNASTGADATRYFVSLPSNRQETWFWLAREMLGAPVMREFYKERDVVMEERRMRTDSDPFGSLLEAVLNAAFTAHPYRDNTIGHMDDLKRLDRPEMIAFWKRHYTADRMVVAVVGNVDPSEVFALAEKYLADLPPAAQPRSPRTREPRQKGPRTVEVVRPASPALFAAWHTPSLRGRTGVVHDVLGAILHGGASSRLHTRLVKKERVAAMVEGIVGFPGRLDATLSGVILVPTPGHSLEECLALTQEEIEILAEEGPTERELEGVRRRSKMGLLESLGSNPGLAGALARAEAEEGGWETLFESLDSLEGITAGDIKKAAATYLPSQRTVGYLLPPGMDASTPVGGGS